MGLAKGCFIKRTRHKRGRAGQRIFHALVAMVCQVYLSRDYRHHYREVDSVSPSSVGTPHDLGELFAAALQSCLKRLLHKVTGLGRVSIYAGVNGRLVPVLDAASR